MANQFRSSTEYPEWIMYSWESGTSNCRESPTCKHDDIPKTPTKKCPLFGIAQVGQENEDPNKMALDVRVVEGYVTVLPCKQPLFCEAKFWFAAFRSEGRGDQAGWGKDQTGGCGSQQKKQGMVDEKSDNFCGGLFVATVEVWKVNFLCEVSV